MADPTPGALRHAAVSDELGEPWMASGVQKYLGDVFGSPNPARPAAQTARLRQTLASLACKQEGYSGPECNCSGAAADRIAAYMPTLAVAAQAPTIAPSMTDDLAADYRAQLQRYAQHLAAKEAEVLALRQAAAELRQKAASAESRTVHAGEQLSRHAAAAGQLEAANAALERQLAEREAEVAAAVQARRTAEQTAAAASAQAIAAQKAAGGRVAEFEAERRYFKEQLERRDEELLRLEDALRKQAAEVERSTRDWAAHEAELSAAHSRTHGTSAAAQAEMAMAQEALDAANRRARTLEADNAELRRQKAAAAADLRMLEELLADGDAERRELYDKYVRLGERMEALVKEGKILKSSASAESSTARTAVQEAMKDAEAAANERAGLVSKLRELQAKLDEEAASRSALKDRAQRKLAAAEQEVTLLRSELESKARQLQGLQAGMKSLQTDAEFKLGACEKQVLAFKERASSMKQELEHERQRACKAKEAAESLYSEQLKVELQTQALKYERRIQELEVSAGASSAGTQLLASPAGALRPGGSVLDYIPRAEHLRLLEARLAAKESDMQLELNSRVAQVEREWQWKLESKEQEVSSLTARTRQLEDDMHTERQRASSQAHKVGDEAKRLGAQCLELQRELESQTKEAARLKETLKDARTANADMDDDALTSSRQVARLRHALEDSQGTLKEAQAALGQERQRREELRREAQAQAAKAADATKHCERLGAEVADLQATLDQKQDLISALQAESDSWNAKLMAHREYHEQEVEALRRAAKEEGEAKVSALEQECEALSVNVRRTKQQHEEAMANLTQQHTAQVAQLETQLAAAERCSAELREITTALGSVRQEDVEIMRNAINELQLRLKEAAREQERAARQHASQLAALAGQMSAKLTAYRTQQSQLKQQVEGEVAAAAADCLAGYEAGLAAYKAQLDMQACAAEAQRAELAAQSERLQGALQHLLAALLSQVPTLPQAAIETLQGSAAAAASPVAANGSDTERAAAAAQAVAAAVRAHTEGAEAAAVHLALAALEAELLPEAVAAAMAQAAPASPSKLLASVRRQQAAAGSACGRRQLLHQPLLSIEANEGRLAALLLRSQELLAAVAAGESQVAALRQQLTALEAATAAHAEQLSQGKREGMQAAQAARAAAVAPLQAEVARLTERVQGLQQLHASELADLEAAARQQTAAAQADAQAAVDRLTASGASLQQRLQGESQRAEGLAADVARMQGELAKHTQRAASRIELQGKEVEMLKSRIREMEARDASCQQELRGLRQRDREAAAALAAGSLGRA